MFVDDLTSYLAAVYEMKYINPTLCTSLLLVTFVVKSQADSICHCDTDSCTINWNFAKRNGEPCYLGDVCGEGRGLTRIEKTDIAWERKIRCEVCGDGTVRTLIPDLEGIFRTLKLDVESMYNNAASIEDAALFYDQPYQYICVSTAKGYTRPLENWSFRFLSK
jgi:hypothetical protein